MHLEEEINKPWIHINLESLLTKWIYIATPPLPQKKLLMLATFTNIQANKCKDPLFLKQDAHGDYKSIYSSSGQLMNVMSNMEWCIPCPSIGNTKVQLPFHKILKIQLFPKRQWKCNFGCHIMCFFDNIKNQTISQDRAPEIKTKQEVYFLQ